MNIYDILMAPLEKSVLTRIRKKIIPLAFGSVLELGYGTGANFRYYDAALIKSISALEMQPTTFLKTKPKLPIGFFEGRAEKLPFSDESFDTVVETLVFCSVEHPDIAIGEVLRVLKTGGIFIFIDHVLPEKKSLANLFRATDTFWPKITGGCNLTRETHKLIEASGLVMEQSGRAAYDIFRWGIGRKAS